METDPIVEEVRKVRDEFARAHGYDVDAMVRALQEESARQGRKLVTFPPRAPEDGVRETG